MIAPIPSAIRFSGPRVFFSACASSLVSASNPSRDFRFHSCDIAGENSHVSGLESQVRLPEPPATAPGIGRLPHGWSREWHPAAGRVEARVVRSRSDRGSAAPRDPSGFAGTGAAHPRRMTSKILFALLLSANLASADDRPAASVDSVDAAVAAEHEASTREHYNAQLTTIAERDIVTAQIVRDMAVKQWNEALREHRSEDADRWAQRHASALRDER